MPTITEVTEGWTNRLTFQLWSQSPSASTPSEFVGTGFTVSGLYVRGKDGNLVTTSGNFGWVTAAAGTVYYDPDAADLDASLSPYTVHFEVTDGSGKIVFFPSGKPDTLVVYRK